MGIGSEPGWLKVWERLMVTHAEVIRRLEADLLAQHKISLTWFDVMSVLERAPEHRIRMHKLADAVLITRSGLTRVADQLEEQGFVVRVRSTEDRRTVWLTLTEAGHQKLREVWPDHRESIYLYFGQYLDAQDAEAIREATEKVFRNYHE